MDDRRDGVPHGDAGQREGEVDSPTEPLGVPMGSGVSLPSAPIQVSGLPGRIGRYRVVGALGHGGMGVVYDAVQDGSDLRVALKVMDHDLHDHPEARARFEAEARTLARLRHPNIALIHDSGSCRVGRRDIAFIAMELIRDGLPITVYAERKSLGLRERVGLMLSVVRAIQHAHARPVIHRDLKPSNILVDENGTPKVIDFGVARLDEAGSEHGGFTTFGQVIGTLGYMPDEQTTGDPSGVDVRCDIYALGIVLYELLTGGRPMKVARPLERKGYRRGTVPASEINRRIDDDLDLIVARAIEPDADLRFATAAQFADQLERWLDGRPVSLGRVSGVKRFRKFIARHRVATTAVVLAAGICFGLIGLALRNGQESRHSLARSESLVAFLLDDMLASLDPEAADGGALTVEELLDKTSASIGNRFADEPALAARIRLGLGQAYFTLREIPSALREATLSVELFEREPGSWREMIQARHLLAQVWIQTQEFDRALPALQGLLEDYREHLPAGDEGLIRCYHDIAWCHMSQRNYPEAIAWLREAMELARKVSDVRPIDLIYTETLLADALVKTAEYDAALVLLDEAEAALANVQGDTRLDLARILTYRSDALMGVERYQEAERAARSAFEIREAIYGPEHPIVCAAMVYLAKALSEIDRAEESVPLLERALSVYERSMAADRLPHRHALATRVHLARALARSGEPERAITEADRTLRVLATREIPPTDETALGARIARMESLLGLGRLGEAASERSFIDVSGLPSHHMFWRYLRRLDDEMARETPGARD